MFDDDATKQHHNNKESVMAQVFGYIFVFGFIAFMLAGSIAVLWGGGPDDD